MGVRLTIHYMFQLARRDAGILRPNQLNMIMRKRFIRHDREGFVLMLANIMLHALELDCYRSFCSPDNSLNIPELLRIRI